MTDAERDLNMKRFPPGSAAAITMGCICGGARNGHGLGYMQLTSVLTGEREPYYFIDGRCPLHTETSELLEGYAGGLT